MSLGNRTFSCLGRASLALLVLHLGQGTLANCSSNSLPSDFSESYKELFTFTQNLQVKNLMGIDECKTTRPGKFPWVFQCDSQGNFIEARALIYESPKIEFIFNQNRELEINYSKGSEWDYSKVEAEEEAQIITRADQFTKVIYTTTSAKKVYLHLYKDATPNITQVEGLTYRMAIGKPVLEFKYSCENI